MVNNKMLIDSKLIELKDYIDQILDPNYYSNKINDNLKIRTLNITVNSFISSLSEQIKSLPQIDYLSNQINDLINSLDDKYKQVNFQSLNPRMQNARKTAWKNIKNEFNKSNSVLVDLLHNESLEIDTKFSDVVLTRNEVVLLITYLRELHIISDQVQDIDLAKYFHEMTGFSESKLKQKLAGLGKSEHNLITDQEPSYDKLLGIFKAIIDIIDKDKRSAILKKGKKKLIK